MEGVLTLTKGVEMERVDTVGGYVWVRGGGSDGGESDDLV